MSKAVLVLPEMPENCLKCPVGENKSIAIETCIYCKPIRKCILDKETENRPNFCPLCPMPERVYYGKDCSEWDDGYQTGVAATLRAIEGSGEDG